MPRVAVNGFHAAGAPAIADDVGFFEKSVMMLQRVTQLRVVLNQSLIKTIVEGICQRCYVLAMLETRRSYDFF